MSTRKGNTLAAIVAFAVAAVPCGFILAANFYGWQWSTLDFEKSTDGLPAGSTEYVNACLILMMVRALQSVWCIIFCAIPISIGCKAYHDA
jgi:hypothetical protein